MGVKKILGKILRAGGSLLGAKDQSHEEKMQGLQLLAPRAQYLKSIARPFISIEIISVLMALILIRAGQQIFKVPTDQLIEIPSFLWKTAQIVVTAVVCSRGFEKIASILKGKMDKP